MTGPTNPRRERLGHRLRDLRVATGLSGTRFAESKLGWPQSKVSRIETGMQIPSEDDLRAWLQAAEAASDVATGLFDLLAAVHAEYTATRDLVRRGQLASRQAVLAELETHATRFAEYQPAFVPGLVQTTAYARAVLRLPGVAKGANDAEIEAMVAARVRRQDLLYEPGHRVQLVLGEAALLSTPAGLDVHAAQMEKLASVAGLASVEMGIVPLRSAMVALPLSGFRLLDDDMVIVESLAGEQCIDDSDEVASFVSAFDALRGACVTGADAVAMIRGAVDELRRGSRDRSPRLPEGETQ